MRVLLQNVVTLDFLCWDSGWTTKREEALDFGEVIRAVDYAFSHRLDDVRVVIKFEDSRLDFSLPPLRSPA